MFGDNFFKKVQNKTNVDKNTIINLAEKLQNANMKDEKTIRSVISEISNLTGKNVTKEKEDKIVNAKVAKLFTYQGLKRTEVEEAGAGDIVAKELERMIIEPASEK